MPKNSPSSKVLGLTADNATVNDVMTDELEMLVDSFDGQDGRARCFGHIVNLAAKSLLRQFDVPKKQAGAALDEAERALRALAIDVEVELGGESEDLEDLEDTDNIDGWVDEQDQMSDVEVEDLQESVCPVKFVLLKVSDSVYVQLFKTCLLTFLSMPSFAKYPTPS